MFKWVQSGLSAVAGTAEPEYGPDAIQPVTKDLDPKKPWNPLTEDDLKWQYPEHTHVETQTFYFNSADTGYLGFAQVIHSNVVGLHTNAQFTFKIFHKDTPEDFVWTSTGLENFRVEGPNFFADHLSIKLIDDKTYHLKSLVNPESIVDLTITRLTDGVKFGKDGTTYYGEDPENPWGSMRHIFWPRCHVKGKILLENKSEDKSSESDEFIERPIEGISMYVMALQGMKPHHAAATWNFLNYVSPDYSVVIMEFTTPPSYATTKVTVGIVSNNEKVVLSSINNETKYIDRAVDDVTGWSIPTSIEFDLSGYEGDSQLRVVVKGKLEKLSERVDVMAEIPQFVKNIVSGIAGTKPFIYQFNNPFTFTLAKDGEEIVSEEGNGYNEATFITEI
ncbi:hypothetical protein LJB42_003905 [Komagataella kurtzmanii]|nr:hypothetical protein LJB42_003905 [Komagataella kurtzmanii]